jgi:branched-chain amino acid transport system ATP-binding protein
MATTRTPRPRRDRGDSSRSGEILDLATEVLSEVDDPSQLLHEASQDAGDLSFASAAMEETGGFWDAFNLKKVAGAAGVTPLAILFGLNAVDELDRIAFGTLTPEIQEIFGLSLTGLTALTTVVLFVNLLLELPIGYIADRRNRVRIATIGAFAWGFFSILTGISIGLTSLGVLYIARLGSAIAKNLNTTHRSLLSDYYPIEARARVFYAHNLANNVGQIVGPLVAGVLGSLVGAQAPFYVLALPTFVFVFLAATRLREPKRGVNERLAAGADQATAEVEEKAAGFAETFRVLFNNKSARRIYYSLPFLTASGIGLGTFMSVYYDNEFGLGPFQRGLLTVLTEGFQIAGVVFGFSYVQKVMTKNPGLVMKLLAGAAVLYSATILGLSVSHNLALSIAFGAMGAAANSILGPGVLAVISLVIPPRMRALGFATGAVWYILGAPFGLIISSVGDNAGIRHGLQVVIPIYLLGSFLLSSAGGPINDDIRKVQESALTQAEARKRRLDGDPQMMVIRGLNAGYDQTQILFDVDFEVADGEIIALLGTNGAGKSTLLKAISGILQPMSGAIIFDGQDITNSDAIQSAHMGIAQVPGGRGIFPSLTVAENLRAAGWMYRKDRAYVHEATERVLDMFPILRKRKDTPAGALSGGEQQMLSLSQAFIAKPKLLMIDELSLGLAPTIVEQLLEIVRAIHDQGTTIILVEQSVNVALRIAKRAVFMEKGEIRFFGPTDELLERPDILRSVFLQGAQEGMELGAGNAENKKKPAEKTAAELAADKERRDALLGAPVVLEATDIVKRYGGVTAVNQANFQLHEGQILGLIGPNGAGKTTIFDMLSGFIPIDGGHIELLGRDITSMPPYKRAAMGLGRSFQDARLWQSLTVREALAASLAQLVEVTSPLAAAFGLPSVADSEARVDERVEELIALLGLGAFRDKFISELSTGSRRMVEIATLIANEPKVLILDEPSSGIAQKETEALGPVLKEVQRFTGCAILIIEHDMPLLAGLADHVVGLELGAVIAFGTPDEVLNHPRVIESYLGTASYEEIGIGVGGTTATATETDTTPRTRRRRRSTEDQQ